MTAPADLVDWLRATDGTWREDREAMYEAAEEIIRLTARVAQLEACLTDVKEQLEMRGIKE